MKKSFVQSLIYQILCEIYWHAGKGVRKDEMNFKVWLCSANNVYTAGTPGGPVVKNPPSNVGNSGSIPSWETKAHHAPEQLNIRATTRDAYVLKGRHSTALSPTKCIYNK